MRVESSYSENTIDFSKWFTEKPLTLWKFVQKHFINFEPYWYVKNPKLVNIFYLTQIPYLSIVDTKNDHTIKVPDELLCKNGMSYRQLASKDPQIFLNYYTRQPVRCLKPIIKELLNSLENCENILKYKLPEMEQIKNQFSELKKAIKVKLSNPIGE